MRRRCCCRTAETEELWSALADLNALMQLFNCGNEYRMSTPTGSPTGYVQILQSDLDTFTSEITAAVAVLTGYIQSLIAGQGTPLKAADEAAITAAVTSLSSLEPPTPVTPAS